MKKIVTAAIAAVIASTSLGVASAADAQSRGHGPRHEQRADRQDRKEFRQDQRQDRREFRQDQRQENRAFARYQRATRHYNAGAYRRPAGYVQRSWAYGQRLPASYRTRTYVVNNYGSYGLRAPPRGYQYTRVGNDVVLTAVATGLIASVLSGAY